MKAAELLVRCLENEGVNWYSVCRARKPWN